MKKLLFILIVTQLVSCSNLQDKESDLITIDALKALENRQKLTFSTLFDNVVYIPLEQTPKSLVTPDPYIALTEEYIIARNQGRYESLLVFDRRTGKFVREIGTMGRGPKEYSFIPLDFYDSNKRIIYTLGSNDNILTFNLNGDYLEDIKLPNCFGVEGISFLSSGSFDTYLDSTTYVSYISNISGNERKKMILFSKDSLVKVFPNYLSWKRAPSKNINVLSLETLFFHYNNKLFFKEAFNDTLFEVRKDNLIPRFVFSFGKYSMPYELQDEYLSSGKWKESMYVDRLAENSDYLFFSLRANQKSYLAFYNKDTKKTKVCMGTDSYPSALIDDINGFLSVIRFNFTSENELVSSFEALQVKKWLDSNPEKATLLRDKFPWLMNLTESSNPVVMIAKCKD
jgi:hypothetical protein